MSKETILLVEDEQLIRKTTARFLLDRGFFILEAGNGEEGLQIFREKQPDLVITDLRMPVMDGMQFMQIVVSEAPDTPILVFSGMGKMVDVIDALRAGAWDYITKPLQNMEVLEHCVSRALERATFIKNERRQKEALEAEVKVRTEKLEEKNQRLLEEIAKRKHQEEQVLKAKLEWERTVDAMPDMVAIIDNDHRIVRVNETLLDRVGTSYEEIQGKKCYICIHGCTKPAGYCVQKQMMKEGIEKRVEIYEENLGGYCEIIASPYHDQNGKLVGSVHIIRDINERRQAEKEREKLLSRLLHAQKLESVGQLASGIAHEINTPTQFISSNINFLEETFAEILESVDQISALTHEKSSDLADKIDDLLEQLDWQDLKAEISDALKQSRDGASMIGSIVKAMKEFSHPGTKNQEIADINRLIETTVTVARNEWKYVANVETVLKPDLPEILCYCNELSQVILNMIVNSSHAIAEKLGATPEGRKGNIKISTDFDLDKIIITIQDSGTGIPEKIQNRVFDPFFTTKNIGRGTGQGLAIAHDVITEKHGGQLNFTTVKDEGTTFKIELPIDGKPRKNNSAEFPS